MIQQFKTLLKIWREEEDYMNNFRKESLKKYSQQILQVTIKQSFKGDERILSSDLQDAFLENEHCYDSIEISIFIKHFFKGGSITVQKLTHLLSQSLRQIYYPSNKIFEQSRVEYDVIQCLHKMIEFANKIQNLKRKFKQSYDVEQLGKLIASKQQVCPEKTMNYSKKDIHNLSFIFKELKQRNMQSRSNIFQFFDEQVRNDNEHMLLDAPDLVKKSSKAHKIARYLKFCIEQLQSIQELKQAIIINTRISYQNIYYFFSPSSLKQVTIQQCIMRFKQFSSQNMRKSMQRVVIRHGNNLNFSLQSVKFWFQPRSETYQNILQKRNLVAPNSNQFSQILNLIQKQFDFQSKLIELKVDAEYLKNVYKDMDQDKKGTISLNNISSFLYSYDVKCTHKNMMMLAHRFTNSYSSTTINYSQFLSELKYQ